MSEMIEANSLLSKRYIHKGGWSFLVKPIDGGFGIAVDCSLVFVCGLYVWVATEAQIESAITDLTSLANRSYGITPPANEEAS